MVAQHQCRNVIATCYDSKDELHEKYPQVEGTIQEIYSAGSSKPKRKVLDGDDPSQEQSQENADTQGDSNNNSKDQNPRHGPKILYSIDARKLGHTVAGGGKDVRMGLIPHNERRCKQIPAWKQHQLQQQQQQQQQKQKQNIAKTNKKQRPQTVEPSGPWDIICFNFPHVGGLSTDVNRQVRSNQELLVAFFKSCAPLLSIPSAPQNNNWDDDDSEEEEDYSWEDDPSDSDTKPEPKPKARTEPGQILVTLFESEPYTLWNIRDLARHAGLKVVTSFRFPWASYEGYTHARTLGHIEQKHGGGGRGGWKGEERDARMYVFEVNRERSRAGIPARPPQDSSSGVKRKKSSRDDGSDSDNSE